MGKSSPQPPAPPDPVATANAQTGSNVNTAIANAIMGNANEIGPGGSVTYKQIGTQRVGPAANANPSFGGDPRLSGMAGLFGTKFGGSGLPGGTMEGFDVPQFERTVTLSPEQQRLYDQQTQLGSDLNHLAIGQTGRLNDVLGQPISAGGLPGRGVLPNQPNYHMNPPDMPNLGGVSLDRVGMTFGDAGDIQRNLGPTDFEDSRRRVEDALYARLNPQLDRDRASLENTLVNQGFVRGSQAFNESMDEANRQANDARLGVIRAGGDEQSRLFNIALQSGEFGNQAQQQAYGQELGRGAFEREGVGINNQAQMSEADFNNQIAQQRFANAQMLREYGNDLQSRQFGDNIQLAQAYETQRERALQEQLAMRNQPINEISALMNGGQVTMPNFSPFNAPTVANTPVGDYIYNSSALANQNYNTQMQQKNAALGGLFGLGSSAILGAMMPGAGAAPLLGGLFGRK